MAEGTDNLAGSSSPQVSAAASAPPGASSTAPAASPPSGAPAVPAGAGSPGGMLGGTPAPATPAGTPAAPEYQSVRDALANYGLDLRGQFSDDHAALQHLIGQVRAAQSLQQLAQYGQAYLQQAPQFAQWQQAQEAARRQAAQAQAQWFRAPEYDPRWLSQITRDSTTGELRVVAGAPPEVLPKYNAWIDHQRSFLDRFSRDPIGAIRPGIEQVVQQVAEQMVQQHLGNYRETSEAQRFVAEHSGWLHSHDAQGHAVMDPRTGREQLSPLGQRFEQYVREAAQMGLQGTQAQARYALGLVQRDYVLAQAQAAAGSGMNPADPGAAAKASFVQTAQAGAQAAPGANVNGQAPPATGPRGLYQRLMANMAANGFGPGQQLVG